MVESLRAKARDLAASALVLAVALVVVSLAWEGDTEVMVDLGPNDASYIEGFASHYEVEDSLAVRWSTYDAKVMVPLTATGGPFGIAYRFQRVFAETADVQVFLGEQMIDRFSCRGGEMQARRVELAAVSETPLRLRFVVDSHEGQDRGLRFDWVRFDVGDRASLEVVPDHRWLLSLFPVFVLALLRFSGHTFVTAIVGSALSLGLLAWGLSAAPFELVHLSQKLIVLGAGIAVAAGWVLRRFPHGRWALIVLVIGFFLRGSGLFYPSVFYPDVANARDYVETFRETTGSLAERGVHTQELTNVGFPRNVGGKDYAFPYSPLYFAPFGLVGSPEAIEDAVRYAGLAAATLAVVPIFWLGLTFFGPLEGVLASLLWTLMPPVFSRLLLALHATVVGSFFDLVVIVSITWLILQPSRPKRLLLVYLAIQASLLVYTSSLFSVSAFVACVSAIVREIRLRLLATLLAAGTLTVTWLYWPFLIAFVTEIVPALLSKAGDGGVSGVSIETTHPAIGALARIPLFYGFVLPILAAFGFVIARNEASRESRQILTAWALAFVLMLSLRGFGFGVFKDLKEIVFVAPLVAILSAAALSKVASRGIAGKVAAIALTAWLVVFGLGRYRTYLETYPSVVTGVGVSALEEGETRR